MHDDVTPVNEDDTPNSNGECVYECDGSNWVFSSGNPAPGYYCPASIGTCSPSRQGMKLTVSAYPE